MSAGFELGQPRQQVGRFELIRMLGRGALATVWLAHDPRLDREVALKCLDPAAGQGMRSHWLNEARAVSRLSHPNIVPLFEADQHEDATYLVFEYVKGRTLAQWLTPRTPMPATTAVALMLGVLAGLSAAHRQGIVHGDLKPSNVLVDADGRARVMDFGIAARLRDAAGGHIVGTPARVPPDAACGAAPSPDMDLMAAGALLGQLLCGHDLWAETHALRGWQRALVEVLRMPVQLELDDRLRAIVDRATALDPQRRFDSAQALQQALAEWLAPLAPTRAPVLPNALPATHGTLEFLLRRMRHRSDFPALSESVLRIQRMTRSDSESLSSLCAEILKDVALTNKLLRMVNTAHYGPNGAGGIGTISRAVSLVGLAGIRNLALSLLLLEQMHNRAHADQLQLEFLRALMAGTLASELAAPDRERETLFLGAMFQGLGRLLTEFYLPEEALQIRQQLSASNEGVGTATTVRREAIALQVLGLSYEDLGVGVARSWGLPDVLLQCMRVSQGAPPMRPAEGAVRQRWLGSCANALTDALLESPPQASAQAVRAVAERFSRVLALPVAAMLDALLTARAQLTSLVQALHLQVPADSPATRLLAAADPEAVHPHPHPQQQAQAQTQAQSSLCAATPQLTMAQPRTRPAGAVERPAAAAGAAPVDQLAAGLHDISEALLAPEIDLNHVLRMVLEAMYRALGFQRVIFCLRDGRSEMLTGRFGLGLDSVATSRCFRVLLAAAASTGPDLFGAVCRQGADTLISDASAPNVAAGLPAWYRQHVRAGAFLLLPMQLKGAPIGLIYADKAQPSGIQIAEREMSLLRTLRNQAVMAFRQVG